eukprot:GEMP01013958.1.p1 GENE.GEMP01013958.1~~GEMP01013958.1.p1  ORF type:complete len:541 (+),score=66.36 GEMP01013958.1:290-1912(+)
MDQPAQINSNNMLQEVKVDDASKASKRQRNSILSDHMPLIGRQEFFDAQFEIRSKAKLQKLSQAEEAEGRYDVIFGLLIIVNLIVVGIEIDNRDPSLECAFWWLESCFLIIFLVELLFRLQLLAWAKNRWCHRQSAEVEPAVDVKSSDKLVDFDLEANEENARVRWYLKCLPIVFNDEFTRHSWMFFDFSILALSALDVWILDPSWSTNAENQVTGNYTPLRVLRLARIVRSVKIFEYFKDLWLLITGLGQAFKTILWVVALLILTIYLFALLVTTLVRQNEEEFSGTLAEANFGTVPRSMYSLFVVMTLESWDVYCQQLMEVNKWYSVLFIVYILFTHFTVLNLFIAVIVDHVRHISSTSDIVLMKEVRDRQRLIFEQLHEAFRNADIDSDDGLTISEFRRLVNNNMVIRKLMRELRLRDTELDWLFETMDTDGSGSLNINEFVDGVLRCRESEMARNMMRMQYTIVREMRSFTSQLMADPEAQQSMLKIPRLVQSRSLAVGESNLRRRPSALKEDSNVTQKETENGTQVLVTHTEGGQ